MSHKTGNHIEELPTGEHMLSYHKADWHEHAHGNGHDPEMQGPHGHKGSFWTKYVFCQDHKMISKQFLITAIFMAVVGMVLSTIFRLQLGWPDHKFPILEAFL